MALHQGIIDYTEKKNSATFCFPCLKRQRFFTFIQNKIAVSAQYASSGPVALHARLNYQEHHMQFNVAKRNEEN